MGRKILVVDDESDVVTYLCTVLRDHGYEAAEAFNGEEALEQVQQDRPDLETLDITMPEMTGVKAYRRLKEDPALRAIPVLIMTGITHDFKQFISSRMQVPPPEGYLDKPVKPEELLAEVKRLIGWLPLRRVTMVRRSELSAWAVPSLGKTAAHPGRGAGALLPTPVCWLPCLLPS